MKKLIIFAFLNSHPVRVLLGGFLIGKQIGTSIFEYMHVPKYDPHNSDHQRLVDISEMAHAKRSGTRNTEFLPNKFEREVQMLD